MINIDKTMEEELKRICRMNLHDFNKTITGDEKTKTNPTQIFKIHIVL